ncbi:ROK family protein [Tessaracoccus sp. Y36]
MIHQEQYLETQGMPALHPPTHSPVSHVTAVAWWIALRGLYTRSELSRATGLGRSQVAAAWERLKELNILEVAGTEKREQRGQPSAMGRLNPSLGQVMAIDCGASLSRVAITTMGRAVLLRKTFVSDLEVGPDAYLDRLADTVDDALSVAISTHGPLRQIVIGIPARIDYSRGAPVRPTIMPGWDGFRVGQALQERYGCDCLVDNEVNLRAYAESLNTPRSFPVISVKVGWGIGAGIALGPGYVLRGFSGAAGEMGHTPVAISREDRDVRCRCGKMNCIEAWASLGAIIGELYGEGPAQTIDLDAQNRLIADLSRYDMPAHDAVLKAGQRLGNNLANVCDLLNPRLISLTSILNETSEGLLAGLRASVHAGARPLASRDVSVRLASFGTDTGLIGGTAMGIAESLKTICQGM